MPTVGEVGNSVICASIVYAAPFRNEQELIEHFVDGGTRLVDGSDHRPSVGGEVAHGTHDGLSLERIEARRGLVKEHTRGVLDQLNPDVRPLALCGEDCVSGNDARNSHSDRSHLLLRPHAPWHRQ